MLHAGVSGLERSDPGEGQASQYALQVADTYLVPAEVGKPVECLTSLAPRGWADVAYYFKVGSSVSSWLLYQCSPAQTPWMQAILTPCNSQSCNRVILQNE